MRKPLILLAAGLMLFSASASAQKLDVSTIKCRDFAKSSTEHIALILMWLQGYYSDEDASPIVDFDKMKKDANNLADYCSKNPDHSVITAAEESMEDD